MPAGRPSKYDPKYVEQAEKLCLLGATEAEVADFFKVDVVTIYRWKVAHPEFCNALKVGKEAADNRVEQSLYHRALGYSHKAVKIFNDQGAPLEVEYTEHYPPDTTACIFWLKNRRRDSWRDRHDHELTGKDGGPIQSLLQSVQGASVPVNTEHSDTDE